MLIDKRTNGAGRPPLFSSGADPMDELAVAVIKQAVKDLKNPIYAKDARRFLEETDIGEIILEGIDQGWQVHI